MKKFKRMSMALILAVSMLLSFATVSQAAYSKLNSMNFTSNGGIDIVLESLVETTGWTVTVRNMTTNESLDDITPSFGTNSAGNKTMISVQLPTTADQKDIWYGIEVKNADGELVQFVKAFMALRSNTLSDSYMKDINLYNSIVKIVPVGGTNVVFTKADGNIMDAKYTNGVYCLDETTKMPYQYTTTGATTATYTVNMPVAGEYTLYYYYNVAKSGTTNYNGSSNNAITVNGTQTGTITGQTTTNAFLEIGKFNFTVGTNTMAITQDTSTNTDRLYAGDIWLVPTTVPVTPYSGLDVYGVEFFDDETEIDNITGEETKFSAKVIYNALGKGDAGDDSLTVITALYDSEGRLVAAVPETKAATPIQKSYTENKRIAYAAGSINTTPIDLTAEEYKNAASAKVFVWDSLGSLTPILAGESEIPKAASAQ